MLQEENKVTKAKTLSQELNDEEEKNNSKRLARACETPTPTPTKAKRFDQFDIKVACAAQQILNESRRWTKNTHKCKENRYRVNGAYMRMRIIIKIKPLKNDPWTLNRSHAMVLSRWNWAECVENRQIMGYSSTNIGRIMQYIQMLNDLLSHMNIKMMRSFFRYLSCARLEKKDLAMTMTKWTFNMLTTCCLICRPLDKASLLLCKWRKIRIDLSRVSFCPPLCRSLSLIPIQMIYVNIYFFRVGLPAYSVGFTLEFLLPWIYVFFFLRSDSYFN